MQQISVAKIAPGSFILKIYLLHPRGQWVNCNMKSVSWCLLATSSVSWLSLGRSVLTIVPFHKSQDTLLHPGLNDQIQNTLFTEDPHVTRALWGWFDWLPGSACADLNWSALVNHIGIHPLPATQPTLIGHALYIKPRPSQFSVLHVPPCMHGNGEIFVCNI